MIDSTLIQDWFKQLQNNICSGLEDIDGSAKFGNDDWQRAEGGGGCTRVINGQIIEKGGVAFSAVSGQAGAKMIKTLQITPQIPAEELNFLATGVSIVLHPRNPLSPIIHMNVRYFELSDGTWWFGGGIDLSPHYVDANLAVQFHQQLKAACDAHHPNFYPEFKAWADTYFYLAHRKEARGVGGIFFDRLNDKTSPLNKAQLWEFVKQIGETFVPAYRTQIEATRHLQPTAEHSHWQSLRRSRYVEFNLVWDRGTHFGLQTNGRTESILMSMPPQAVWIYDYQPQPHSPEAETLAYLQNPQHWI